MISSTVTKWLIIAVLLVLAAVAGYNLFAAAAFSALTGWSWTFIIVTYTFVTVSFIALAYTAYKRF